MVPLLSQHDNRSKMSCQFVSGDPGNRQAAGRSINGASHWPVILMAWSQRGACHVRQGHSPHCLMAELLSHRRLSCLHHPYWVVLHWETQRMVSTSPSQIHEYISQNTAPIWFPHLSAAPECSAEWGYWEKKIDQNRSELVYVTNAGWQARGQYS